MIRTDSAGGTQGFLHWPTARHRNLGYSVGFPIHGAIETALPLIPEKAWTRAYNSDGQERDGTWVTDITGMLDSQGAGTLKFYEVRPCVSNRITKKDPTLLYESNPSSIYF